MCAGISDPADTAFVATRLAQRVRIDELPEALIHDIWFRREYDHRYLETIDGESVLVLNTGQPNTDTGPDFLNARIQIGRTEWVGDVEIHRTSSEWIQHQHASDERYNSVIVHVVLTADLWTGRLHRADATPLNEIVLSGFLRRPLRHLLVRLRQSGVGALPCEESWPAMPRSVKQTVVDQLAGKRLSRRTDRIRVERARAASLDQLLYERLMSALGYAKNQEAMIELARRTPLTTLRGLSTTTDVEALLLGSAGLIPDSERVEGSTTDIEYVDTLRERFSHLQARFSHRPMKPLDWRFFRLRPSNFPPVRIAQAAAIISKGLLSRPDSVGRLLNTVRTERDALSPLRRLLSAEMPAFWLTHVRLERPLRGGPTSLGRSRIDHIILNAVLPTVAYEAERQLDARGLAAVRTILRQLPPEDDEITRRYAGLDIETRSADTTQGLHELHGTLCSHHGCLRCGIGRFILSGSTKPPPA